MTDNILWAIGLGVIVLAGVFGFLMWLNWWLPQVTQ
jgi:hypothetical protein